MGLVRLGQLRLLHHSHHRGLPRLLWQLRLGGARAGASDGAVRRDHDGLGRPDCRNGARPWRDCGLQRHQEKTACSPSCWSASRHAPRWPRSDAATGIWRRFCSSSATSVCRAARSSTIRCCHTSRSAEETDRVSSAGYALGYLGGGVLLLVNLAWILQPAVVRIRRHGAATRRRLSASRCGGWSFRFRFFAACRSRRQLELGRDARPGSAHGRLRPTGAHLPRDAPLPARLSALHRDAALSGRHPDDHPDGLDLRRRDRHRSERTDRRVRDGPVPGHSVLVSVRRARHAHRHQARALHRARRLHRSPRSSATS